MSIKLKETVADVKLLAVSLWKAGNYAEARRVLTDALDATDSIAERIGLTINLSQVELAAGRLELAAQLLLDIVEDVELYFDPLIKGKFFITLGAVWYELRETDRAFEAFTASSIWYERAKDFQRKSEVENNLAMLMLDAGRYPEAHLHLNIAASNYTDEISHAQIDETRARVFLAEGNIGAAFDAALASVLALKDEDERRLLLESLETLGKVTDALKCENEAEQISLALRSSKGKVTRAAKILGISHQTLDWKLEHKYPHLLYLREPKKKPRGQYACSSKS